MLLGLIVHVAELGVPVGMLGALLGLLGALQRVILLAEQPPDRVIADRMPLRGERLSQLAGGLAGPPQRALRISAGVGSTRSSSAWSSPGSRSTSRLGPPPGRRTRPRGSGESSSSRTPVYTVGRDSPVRRAIRAPPPRPRARAAAPASRRRCFSVRCGATSSYNPASTASTSTPRRYRPGMPPPQLSDKLVMRGPLWPLSGEGGDGGRATSSKSGRSRPIPSIRSQYAHRLRMTVPPKRKDRNILELSEQGANEEQISMAVERVRAAVRPSTAALPEERQATGAGGRPGGPEASLAEQQELLKAAYHL